MVIHRKEKCCLLYLIQLNINLLYMAAMSICRSAGLALGLFAQGIVVIYRDEDTDR